MDRLVEETLEPSKHSAAESAAGEWRSAQLRAADLRRARLRWVLMLGGVLVVAVGALVYYLFSGRYVSTDDSSVMAAQTSISANISGRVVELDVRDNQPVQHGEVLFRLDERPLKIAVEEAQAKLASARLQIQAAKASYRQGLAELAAARNTVAYEQSEYSRQQHLVQSGISSRAQYEQAEHALGLAQSQLGSAQQQVAGYLALLGGNPNLPVDAHPSVMQAQAALDSAQLQLSYAVVRAPTNGVVAKVEQLQVGDYINAATPVFSLISTRDVWVEANFKEDDMTYMRPGQPAEVSIDTYPGRRLKAEVASMSPGTGAQFSLLPPENATGNWVKVVQRVPVRLRLLDADDTAAVQLEDGMSAEVTVDTGHRRSLLSLFGHALGGARGAGASELTRR